MIVSNAAETAALKPENERGETQETVVFDKKRGEGGDGARCPLESRHDRASFPQDGNNAQVARRRHELSITLKTMPVVDPFAAASASATSQPPAQPGRWPRVVIIGAGFAGL